MTPPSEVAVIAGPQSSRMVIGKFAFQWWFIGKSSLVQSALPTDDIRSTMYSTCEIKRCSRLREASRRQSIPPTPRCTFLFSVVSVRVIQHVSSYCVIAVVFLVFLGIERSGCWMSPRLPKFHRMSTWSTSNYCTVVHFLLAVLLVREQHSSLSPHIDRGRHASHDRNAPTLESNDFPSLITAAYAAAMSHSIGEMGSESSKVQVQAVDPRSHLAIVVNRQRS